MEETPEYVVYQEHTSDAIHHFWATVHIYDRSITQERPNQFTGRTTSYDHEGYGRPLQVANRDHETDPALLHLVRYLRAQEALYDQVTLDLLAAREELARLDPRRREVEPDISNPVVLFGRPIEVLRSGAAAKPNQVLISPKELRHSFGISSNGTAFTGLVRSIPAVSRSPIDIESDTEDQDTELPEGSQDTEDDAGDDAETEESKEGPDTSAASLDPKATDKGRAYVDVASSRGPQEVIELDVDVAPEAGEVLKQASTPNRVNIKAKTPVAQEAASAKAELGQYLLTTLSSDPKDRSIF
ncbi:hypothetical protein D1007_20592 [Hordeum vulgare]|nr:hypothetical protein D1007_20592 [Hordeum vulgare]